LDALLSKKLGVNNFDIHYVDISSPEVLDYIDDVNTIVENRLPLPYVTLNGKPLCWGDEEAEKIYSKIIDKLNVTP
jgi:disulfide oxidoreductase YuzD